MKKRPIKIVFLLFLCLQFSCSSNQHPSETPQSENSPSANDLMKETVYDATKINPDAPVVEINLKARGNSMTDMSYSDTVLSIKAGSTVHLTLTNESKDPTMQHNFVLIDEGSAQKVAMDGLKSGIESNYVPHLSQVYVHTKILKPGEKTEITFPSPEKGQYEFICTFPGHYAKMHGRFIVE